MGPETTNSVNLQSKVRSLRKMSRATNDRSLNSSSGNMKKDNNVDEEWETGEVRNEGLAGETNPRNFPAREGRLQTRKI